MDKNNSKNRSFFSQIVEAKLIEKGFLTKGDLRNLASISFTEAELLRRDSRSKRFKRPLKVCGGLNNLVNGFFYDLKTRPKLWFRKINGGVEKDCLVIKS